MSALTFDTLSAELTQALGAQSQLPHAPTVRCTLGRDKVMVLVEYPIDSAQAEPSATQTLDWLEQTLRHQFDTTGLPEEAADLAGISAALSVQIFLKHTSEPKPFTMRSFVWKVDDGFDDLFGEPFADVNLAGERSLQQTGPAEQLAAVAIGGSDSSSYERSISQGVTSQGMTSQGATSSSISQTLQERERLDLPVPYFQEEELVPAELDDEHLQLDLENDATFAPLPEIDSAETQPSEIHSEIESGEIDEISLAEAETAFEAETERELEQETQNEAQDGAEAEIEDEIQSKFKGEAAGETESDFGPDLGIDAVLSVGDFGLAEELELYSETSLDEELALGLPQTEVPASSQAEFDLPGESPNLESSDEFNLPTLDLPGANVPEINPVDADFFNLEDSGPSSSGIPSASVTSSQPFGMDLTAVLESSMSDEQSTADSDQELEVLEYELLDSGLERGPEDDLEGRLDSRSESRLKNDEADDVSEDDDYLTLDDALEAASREMQAEESVALSNERLDGYRLDGEAFDNNEFDNDELGDGEFSNDESDDSESSDEYEIDSPYYLEGDTAEDDPADDVAWVDEEEVQRQREQWQQQSRSGNPWVFAGLLGFLVIGVLGFVFTRPCTFGQCDRIQAAQLGNADALSDLRVDSSADGVTAAKQQLKRSIGLLAPIPIWSSYYDEAQAELPSYRGQVQALNYVSAAQDKAYSAAVKSQDPPHTVSIWQEIEGEWLQATELLEQVPIDSPVREIANNKLREYRANRATILVRIEAESKAEVGLRQGQQAAKLATKQTENATSLEDWEAALSDWELAVDSLSQIPQGTKAHADAQKLLPDYLKSLDAVRDRTEKERLASRALFQAKQFAADAQAAETEEQWSLSVQHWKSARSKLQEALPGTIAHAEAQAMQGIYAESVKKSENNLQVALRFRPIEPSFFSACGVSGTQRCTYSVRGGNVRLDLFEGYDSAIDQSITPPDERAADASFPQISDQSAELLQKIAALSTQAQVPVEMYDAEGEFMAMYRPDLKGFTR